MKYFSTAIIFLISLTALTSEPYTRADTSHQGEIRLQTAIRQLIPADSTQPQIYLVGAIHIADSTYYNAIQSHLDSYQRVLFECVTKIAFTPVTPSSTFEEIISHNREKMVTLATACAAYQMKKNTPVQSLDQLYISDSQKLRNEFGAKLLLLARTNHLGQPFTLVNGEIVDPANTVVPIGYAPYTGIIEMGKEGLFEEFATLLVLDMQGQHIMYTRPHFQWCDLSIEELLKIAKERNLDHEAFKQALAILDGQTAFYPIIKSILMVIKLIPNNKNLVRLVLIQSLSEKEIKTGTPFDALILDVRNEHVIKEIRKQSHALKTIGVFYGAAHLQDIEDVLCKEDLYKPGETIWLDALGASK